MYKKQWTSSYGDQSQSRLRTKASNIKGDGTMIAKLMLHNGSSQSARVAE